MSTVYICVYIMYYICHMVLIIRHNKYIHHVIMIYIMYTICYILCRHLRVYMWVGRSSTAGACSWAGTGSRKGTL